MKSHIRISGSALRSDALRIGEERLKLSLASTHAGTWECNLSAGRLAVDDRCAEDSPAVKGFRTPTPLTWSIHTIDCLSHSLSGHEKLLAAFRRYGVTVVTVWPTLFLVWGDRLEDGWLADAP